jgi:hypothetical protein
MDKFRCQFFFLKLGEESVGIKMFKCFKSLEGVFFNVKF